MPVDRSSYVVDKCEGTIFQQKLIFNMPNMWYHGMERSMTTLGNTAHMGEPVTVVSKPTHLRGTYIAVKEVA
jgi:hypothetical protein